MRAKRKGAIKKQLNEMNRKENQIKFAHQKKYLGKNCAKRALFIAAAVAALVTHCLDFVIFENMPRNVAWASNWSSIWWLAKGEHIVRSKWKLLFFIQMLWQINRSLKIICHFDLFGCVLSFEHAFNSHILPFFLIFFLVFSNCSLTKEKMVLAYTVYAYLL